MIILHRRFNKERADTSYLKTLGASVSLGKQLKWPDDYFSLIYTLNFTQYKLQNYPIFAGLDSGNSTNFSLKIALQRNSAGPNPIFPDKRFKLFIKCASNTALFII